jgi:hypothetical protein
MEVWWALQERVASASILRARASAARWHRSDGTETRKHETTSFNLPSSLCFVCGPSLSRRLNLTHRSHPSKSQPEIERAVSCRATGRRQECRSLCWTSARCEKEPPFPFRNLMNENRSFNLPRWARGAQKESLKHGLFLAREKALPAQWHSNISLMRVEWVPASSTLP